MSAPRARRIGLLALIAILGLVVVGSLPASPPAGGGGQGNGPDSRLAPHVPGELLVKFKEQAGPNERASVRAQLNAQKVRVTGNKLLRKTYFHHTGYIGSERFIPLRDRMQQHPAETVRGVIWGMLPHNRLGRQMIRKLKVYAGAEHPHQAQRPIPYKLGLHGKGFPAQEAADGAEEA